MKKILLLFLVLAISACVLFYRPQSSKISLVWQFDKTGYWEPDWLSEVLADVDYTEIQDGKYRVLKNNSILVVSSKRSLKRCSKYFEALKKKNYNFGVILLADEDYKVKPEFFKDAKFVIRNHWHKNFMAQKNFLIFPLGYKNGFWEGSSPDQIQESSKRAFTWSFAGQIEKSSRIAMIESMKKIPGYHIHQTYQFGDPNSLSSPAYRDLLLKTVFVPCPRGWWNLDTFRLYEALECGCIPIVEKTPIDYFSKFFGNHPFLSVSSWDEAPALMESLLSDPARLEEHRAKCHKWWLDYKANMKTEVKNLIETHFQQKASS